MGYPTSWSILNVMHLHWIDFATSHDRRQENKCCVCGDDLLANWSERTTRKYHDILRRCGGQISPKKHLVESDTGIFCEEKFTIGPNSKVKFSKAIAFGALLTKASIPTFRPQKSFKTTEDKPTTWMSLALAARSLWSTSDRRL